MAKITFKVQFHSTDGPKKIREVEQGLFGALTNANKAVYLDPGSAPKRLTVSMDTREIILDCVPNMIIWEVIRWVTYDKTLQKELVSVIAELDK